MMPLSTSPVPAVARRASPRRDDAHLAVRVGDHRGRALQQHDGAGAAAASARAAAMRSGPGAVPGEPLELAVVGREHRRRRARPPSTEAASRAERGEAVAVDDGGQSASGDHVARTRVGVAGAGAEPGPDHERLEARREPSSTASAQPAAGSASPTASVGRRRVVGDARASRAAPCPRPARCAAAAARCGRAGHARRAGDDEHRRAATCGASRGRRGSQRATSRGLDDVHRRRADVEPDVGDHDLAGQRPPGLEQQPRLQGGEGDRARGRPAPGPAPRR